MMFTLIVVEVTFVWDIHLVSKIKLKLGGGSYVFFQNGKYVLFEFCVVNFFLNAIFYIKFQELAKNLQMILEKKIIFNFITKHHDDYHFNCCTKSIHLRKKLLHKIHWSLKNMCLFVLFVMFLAPLENPLWIWVHQRSLVMFKL